MTFFGPKLYVGNFNGESVTTCDWVSATKTLSGCLIRDVGGRAWGVAAYSLPGGKATFLFVSGGPFNKRCTITPGDGALSDCFDTGVTASAPHDMVINNNTIYVANRFKDNVLGCPINPTTGDLGACADTQMTEKGRGPFGIAINGGYLYITYSDQVYECPLASLSTTVASPCQLTGANNLSGPADLAFDDGFAYISNFNSNDDKAVTRCAVNGTTGRASNLRPLTWRDLLGSSSRPRHKIGWAVGGREEERRGGKRGHWA